MVNITSKHHILDTTVVLFVELLSCLWRTRIVLLLLLFSCINLKHQIIQHLLSSIFVATFLYDDCNILYLLACFLYSSCTESGVCLSIFTEQTCSLHGLRAASLPCAIQSTNSAREANQYVPRLSATVHSCMWCHAFKYLSWSGRRDMSSDIFMAALWAPSKVVEFVSCSTKLNVAVTYQRWWVASAV